MKIVYVGYLTTSRTVGLIYIENSSKNSLVHRSLVNLLIFLIYILNYCFVMIWTRRPSGRVALVFLWKLEWTAILIRPDSILKNWKALLCLKGVWNTFKLEGKGFHPQKLEGSVDCLFFRLDRTGREGLLKNQKAYWNQGLPFWSTSHFAVHTSFMKCCTCHLVLRRITLENSVRTLTKHNLLLSCIC